MTKPDRPDITPRVDEIRWEITAESLMEICMRPHVWPWLKLELEALQREHEARTVTLTEEERIRSLSTILKGRMRK